MQFKKSLMGAAVLLAMSGTATASEGQAGSFIEAITEGKPTIVLRLRYEHADQDGKSETADALTLRSLVGWKTKPFHNFSVTAQVYGLSPLNDDYNDIKKTSPIDSRKKFPVIADPEDYDFHQLFLEWGITPTTSIKLGRQSMILDNWRFIGDVRFRQNWAVFNGISLKDKTFKNTEIFVSHSEQIKEITTKIQDAKIEMANVKYNITPTTTVSGYSYLIDWEGRAREASSNKTFGLRLNGKEKISEHWTGLFTAEYAKQDDYADGSKDIDNHYYHIGAGAGYGGWFLRLDQEKLSGNSDGKSFQTQLGTNHLYQGWADVFLATPGTGIVDTMLIAGGKFKGVKIKAEYHMIDSDRDYAKVGGGMGDQYGTEFDLGAYYKINKHFSTALEYANFKEDDEIAGGRKRDIERVWLTAMYKY